MKRKKYLRSVPEIASLKEKNFIGFTLVVYVPLSKYVVLLHYFAFHPQ